MFETLFLDCFANDMALVILFIERKACEVTYQLKIKGQEISEDFFLTFVSNSSETSFFPPISAFKNWWNYKE